MALMLATAYCLYHIVWAIKFILILSIFASPFVFLFLLAFGLAAWGLVELWLLWIRRARKANASQP